MKRILILLCCLLFGWVTRAQIAAEHVYDTASNGVMINLSLAGYKYAMIRQQPLRVDIYNLDHSLYKSIPLPSYQNYSLSGVNYISDLLFNNDSQVEVAALYDSWLVNTYFKTMLINENGQVIDSMMGLATFMYVDSMGHYKLITEGGADYKEYVYALPGSIPCVPTCGFVVDVKKLQGSQPYLSGPVPNPASDETVINYELSPMDRSGFVLLFNIQGVLVKKYAVIANEKILRIKGDELPPGNYYYRLQTARSVSATYKLTILK